MQAFSPMTKKVVCKIEPVDSHQNSLGADVFGSADTVERLAVAESTTSHDQAKDRSKHSMFDFVAGQCVATTLNVNCGHITIKQEPVEAHTNPSIDIAAKMATIRVSDRSNRSTAARSVRKRASNSSPSHVSRRKFRFRAHF